MDLYFREYGEGPPLIVLHGLLGASGNWHTLSSRAFGAAFRVYTLDQRNHGRSPHSPIFDYPTMADDIIRFMDRHAIDTAHVLGHSMGGKTAMHLALLHTARVDSLVVADIAPKTYPRRHEVIFEALRATNPAHFRSRAEIDQALAAYVASQSVRQFLMKNLSPDGPGQYRWKINLDGIYQNYDRINVGMEADGLYEGPSLFIRGGASDYVAEEDLEIIRSYFPEADLVTLPGAGHWLHAEAPDAFAQHVLAFLQQHAATDS